MPFVDLPVAIDVIKDSRERDGKSTAVHAKVLAKNYVTIYDYPDQLIPDFSTYGDETYLIFPAEDAISISDAFPEGYTRNKPPRIVFIDATWKQARQLAKLPELSHLPKIKLSRQIQTLYWRYQTGEADSNLATIEVHTYSTSLESSNNF